MVNLGPVGPHPHGVPEQWRDDGKCIYKSCTVWRRCDEDGVMLLPMPKVEAFITLLDWPGAVVLHACAARLEIHDHTACCMSCRHHVIPHTRCILR